MKPITVAILCATTFAGGIVGYKKYEEHTNPKPPEKELFASMKPEVTKLRREDRVFRAEAGTQRERRKRLDEWVKAGVISDFGTAGAHTTQKMTVAPGFLLLPFQEKQTVAVTAFRYLHEIADGTPAEYLQYDRLILVDNLNNHEVGSVALDPSTSSTILTMNR